MVEKEGMKAEGVEGMEKETGRCPARRPGGMADARAQAPGSLGLLVRSQ